MRVSRFSSSPGSTEFSYTNTKLIVFVFLFANRLQSSENRAPTRLGTVLEAQTRIPKQLIHIYSVLYSIHLYSFPPYTHARLEAQLKNRTDVHKNMFSSYYYYYYCCCCYCYCCYWPVIILSLGYINFFFYELKLSKKN